MTSRNLKTKETVSKTTSECHHGIPMTDEELEQYYQDFQDIEESIAGLKEADDEDN